MRSRTEKVNLVIEWILRLIIILTLFKSLIIKDYDNVFLLIITLFLTFYNMIVIKLFKIKLKSELKISIVLFIFGAQYLGTIKGLYVLFNWWDKLLHLVSGVIFLYIGIQLFEEINKRFNDNINPILNILFGFCFMLSIGVIWEIFEFIIDKYFGGNMQRTMNEYGQNALKDTISDLTFATLGGSICFVVEFIKFKINIKKKIS